MVYAIITAAGKGTRANLGIPKQFFKVNGKPLIFYTLKVFNDSKYIDGIILITNNEFINDVEEYKNVYNFHKLIKVVPGGDTNQLSITNGFSFLKSIAKDNDIVVIHDGVRCLVTEEIIRENIAICKKRGNAITAIPCNEAMLYTDDQMSSKMSIDRDHIFKTQTPHSIFFKRGYNIFHSLALKGDVNNVALCTILIKLNKKVYFSKGANSNFKITQPDDILLFNSYLNGKV